MRMRVQESPKNNGLSLFLEVWYIFEIPVTHYFTVD